ncbi:hypothetical protein N2605_25980 [Bradyrhizobium yuanmingense]|uniref:hypothetical protein n=1 Tax=Bradyrhizobium yuanmingense TaxID=108015 RepID=UPI0021A521BD|nr:hypothetical protein [Bradyrhizobium sp. CB1024]UWU83006.1 hypothetical protein N2605_25980 [Bradyrhizobium sp. CB1024]
MPEMGRGIAFFACRERGIWHQVDSAAGSPAQVSSLPFQAIKTTSQPSPTVARPTRSLAEIGAKRVGLRQKIEKKARSDAVLIAEAGSGSELNRGFLLRGGLLHDVVREDSALERFKNICDGRWVAKLPEGQEGHVVSIRYTLLLPAYKATLIIKRCFDKEYPIDCSVHDLLNLIA